MRRHRLRKLGSRASGSKACRTARRDRTLCAGRPRRRWSAIRLPRPPAALERRADRRRPSRNARQPSGVSCAASGPNRLKASITGRSRSGGYERESRPGELIHMCVKKLGRGTCFDGPGPPRHRRPHRPEQQTRHRLGRICTLTCIDDHSRVGSHVHKICPTRRGERRRLPQRRPRLADSLGVTVSRVMTDNGSEAHAFRDACRTLTSEPGPTRQSNGRRAAHPDQPCAGIGPTPRHTSRSVAVHVSKPRTPPIGCHRSDNWQTSWPSLNLHSVASADLTEDQPH